MGNSSDSSTKGNLFETIMISIMVATIFFLGRTWMDLFILTVNCKDWMKKKSLSIIDWILTLQGSIRICFGCTMMLWHILEKLCPWITQIGHVQKAFMFLSWYFISCNIWLTASLCSYYCVKIADFSHPFFIRLKLRLSGLKPTWLLGSAVLALANSLPFVCRDWKIRENGNFPDFFQNKNVTDVSHTTLVFRAHVLLGLGYVAPFSISATSAALLLFSLWRHRQRMLGNWGGHRSPQTDAHFQALVTILSLLISNVVAFISIQLLLSRDFEGHSVHHRVSSVILYSCFTVESIISVWGNKKLKNELYMSLCLVKCRGCVS